jgi:UDP:flavonoid glycosyltransferase YjiC (YdhE family)
MPKRIVLTTYGTFGDLYPYLAIGSELRDRGHQVALATTDFYRDKVLEHGLEFHVVRPHAPTDAEGRAELMRKAMKSYGGTSFILKELVIPALRDSYDDLIEATRGADLLVGHPLALTARLVSEKTGIPWVSSVLQPMCFFSSDDPSVYAQAPVHLLRVFGADFYRWLHGWLMWTAYSWAKPWHQLRAELGLPPTKQQPFFDGQHSPRLTLALFSRHLAAPQPDWPASSRITGFPFLKQKPVDFTACQTFLDNGPAPLVFTLGSSAVMTPGQFYEIAAAATQQLNQRAILLAGDAAESMTFGDDRIFVANYLPHDLVMPSASVIVHQGGVGTTAQALRSGRPQLVVPFAHDQPDNGARITRAGVGRTVSLSRWQTKRAIAELRQLLESKQVQVRAEELGRAVRAEQGTIAAADAIEDVLVTARAA